MKHDTEHRDQLARLHDRHKRLSLMVYDHMTANEEENVVIAKQKLNKAVKELEEMKNKLFIEIVVKRK